jgi:hypothetical protein
LASCQHLHSLSRNWSWCVDWGECFFPLYIKTWPIFSFVFASTFQSIIFLVASETPHKSIQCRNRFKIMSFLYVEEEWDTPGVILFSSLGTQATTFVAIPSNSINLCGPAHFPHTF